MESHFNLQLWDKFFIVVPLNFYPNLENSKWEIFKDDFFKHSAIIHIFIN